jgi:hypothetical protein
MPFFPRTPVPRPPRVRFAEVTPAVLRPKNGKCMAARLQVVSVTGGLLSVPRPLDRGTNVKLMFVSKKGTVSGAAEMLAPISWTEQPFRFLSLEDQDQRKLKAAIQSSMDGTKERHAWLENFRAW